ncbi:abortive infection family protein [Thalassospira sp. MCCC 1A02491]|uniref:abortive infection family protein n=1 Tax=Thalassospira sp. MCCC 1A02491 TaxID=1769751 RepID=UPI0007AD72FD|nr:abortive infection family protein [Thalassospira sp. MCCC 1A02491]KZB66530.1 hypothetical protein AUQ42_13125 [Thalassospira sp. MCCC 1A02491]
MKLTAKPLERLTGIITGDNNVSPYRSGPQLVDFFHDFGERDLYGQGFPSRASYTLEKLKKFNGTETMKSIVCSAFDFWDETDFNVEDVAYQFNKTLARDRYRLVLEYGKGWVHGDEYIKGAPYFEVRSLDENIISTDSLLAASHEAILEQVKKANTKIETGDFAGAIASAYTLVEQLLKHLLVETGTPFKENEGDIRVLYKALREPLRLDPGSDGIELPLKPILDGFQKLVAGLYEVANKASDRHARRYNPAGHHAKLSVNAAFALSEFLLESHQYQQARTASSLSTEEPE